LNDYNKTHNKAIVTHKSNKSPTALIKTQDGGKKMIELPEGTDYNKYDRSYRIIEETENGHDTLIVPSSTLDASVVLKSPYSHNSSSIMDVHKPKYTVAKPYL
jgi:hypothetical protein